MPLYEYINFPIQFSPQVRVATDGTLDLSQDGLEVLQCLTRNLGIEVADYKVQRERSGVSARCRVPLGTGVFESEPLPAQVFDATSASSYIAHDMIHIYRKVYGAPVSKSLIYEYDDYAGSGTFYWPGATNVITWSGWITTGEPNRYRVQIRTWAPFDNEYFGWAANHEDFWIYR